MSQTLGEREWQTSFKIVPSISRMNLLENPQSLLRLAWDVIDLVGMTTDGNPDVRFYPQNGKGGTGIQLYQPLVESWLIIGTWPEHGLLRLNLSSCKSYSAERLRQFLVSRVGAVVKMHEVEI